MTVPAAWQKYLVAGALVAASTLSSVSASAGEKLPSPTGDVILTIEGDIETSNRDGAADFDRTMLRAVGWESVETHTDWTDGVQVFEGVLLRDVLETVAASGDTLRVIALNDYAVEIPASDADRYRVLLALTRNGEAMRVRDKGPIWIIYPQAESAENFPGTHNDKMVWQLRRIVVE